MKIGMLTFHYAINYGAALQLAALYRFLALDGHEPEVVDYRPAFMKEARRRSAGKNLLRAIGAIRKPDEIIPLIRGLQFDAFTQKLKTSDRVYHDLATLRSAPPDVDALICGSDQIWNPMITGGTLDEAYSLNFGAAGTRKISYAASFGTNNPEAIVQGSAGALLNGLEHISVREQIAANRLGQHLMRPVSHVVDPVLLDDASQYLQSPAKAGRYLLIYELGIDPSLIWSGLKLAKALGLKPRVISVRATVRSYITGRGKWILPSVPDFVRWHARASAVITNSFHSTALSVLFNRPFISLQLPGSKAERSARLTDFLETVGLNKQFVSNSESREVERLMTGIRNEFNWDEVEARLAAAREVSRNFLRHALSSG